MMFFFYTGMSVVVPMYWVILSRYFTEISCTYNITNINYSDPAICELFRNTELKCIREGRYADYTYGNCERYVLCTQENDIFVQTSFACPNSYNFDPEKSICVSSDSYECPCSLHHGPSSETSQNPSGIPDQIITSHTTEYPYALQSTHQSQLCHQSEPECVTFGKLPDYSTPGCTSFYTCVRTEEDYFSKLHFKCPYGYVFDSDHEVCTLSDNYKCPCDYFSTGVIESTPRPSHELDSSSQVSMNVETTYSEKTPSTTEFDFEINFQPLVNDTNEAILYTTKHNNISEPTTNIVESTTPQLANTDTLNSVFSTYPVSESSTANEGFFFTTNSNLNTTLGEPPLIGTSTILPTSTIVPNIDVSEGTTQTIYEGIVNEQTVTSDHFTTLVGQPDTSSISITSATHEPLLSSNNNDILGVTIPNVPILEITTELANTSSINAASVYSTTTESPNTIDTSSPRDTTTSVPVTELYDFTDNSNTMTISNIPESHSTTDSLVTVEFQTENSAFQDRPECALRICNATGRLPDYSVPDCRGFILCLSTGLDFLELKYICPSFNIFNPELQICTLPTLYVCPCSNNSSTITTQPNEYSSTTSEIPEMPNHDIKSSTADVAYTTETIISLDTESMDLPVHTESPGSECITSNCSRSERIADYDISECRGYISCVPLGDGSFLELKYRCPNSSVFNSITKMCTEPDLYACPCSTSSATTTIIAATTVNPEEATTNVAMNVCTDDGLFIDLSSSDCSNYIQCVYTDGTFTELNLLCPPDSYFDPIAKLCSATYVCGPASTGYTTTTVRVTTVTSPFIEISTIEQSTSTPSQISNDCPMISCTAQQRIPDNSVPDCKSYITCLPSTGGVFLELKLNCPGPNIFNPDLGICVSPDSYNCTCNVTPELLTPSYITNTTEPIMTTNVDDSPTHSTSSSGCNLTNDICTAAGAIPDYTYPGCKKFRLCRAEADGYSAISYECTESYVFDPSRSACTHNMYYTCPC